MSTEKQTARTPHELSDLPGLGGGGWGGWGWVGWFGEGGEEERLSGSGRGEVVWGGGEGRSG